MKKDIKNIDFPNVCTTDQRLVEGGFYLVKEGRHLDYVILEQIIQWEHSLVLKVFYPEEEKICELSHMDKHATYGGMWLIYDKDYIQKHREKYGFAPFGISDEEDVAMPEKAQRYSLTKERFIETLSAEQKNRVCAHIDTIYECQELTDHEFKIIYLAWLMGEGKVKWTEQIIISDYDVEFDENDYEITFESDDHGGLNPDIIRDYYDLDEIYRILKDTR
jgi:hypothetical protein